MPVIRVTVESDERVDVLLRRFSEVLVKHPGNDQFELLLRDAHGFHIYSSDQGVDSWDPRLRERLVKTLERL